MRSITKEFEEICGIEASPTESIQKGEGIKEMSEARHQAEEMETCMGSQVGTWTGSSSRYINQQLLCSSPLSPISSYPYIPQPPNALHTPPPHHPPIFQTPSLPPSPPPNVSCTPHYPPRSTIYPAYCWHCNLWGNVYTSSMVY